MNGDVIKNIVIKKLMFKLNVSKILAVKVGTLLYMCAAGKAWAGRVDFLLGLSSNDCIESGCIERRSTAQYGGDIVAFHL